MTRAHRSLLILTTVTVLAAGMTAQTLTEPAGAGADIQFAASAILLVISGTLLLRVMRHLSRTPHQAPSTWLTGVDAGRIAGRGH